MPALFKVQVYGAGLKTVQVEAGATKGAVFGQSLWNADGTLVTAEQFAPSNPSEPPPSAVVIWSKTLREIPRNVSEVEELATSGFVVRQSSSDWVTRSILPTIGRTTVANGDGAAGDVVIDLAVVPEVEGGALRILDVDAWGRVSARKAVTIRGTEGQVAVTNGTGAGGDPTVALVEVPNGDGGAILKTEFDDYGRATKRNAATSADLPEGPGPGSLYFTNTRAVAALETWAGGPDYLQLLLDEYNPP